MKKQQPGNITIEASVIVPFMLILLATLLMASLLLHDVYVLRTNNGLNADAFVIAGEDARSGQSGATFLIQPVYSDEDAAGWFSRSHTSSVIGSGTIDFINYVFSADEIRHYSVKTPKSFIRGIDLVNDATDMWATTRETKDNYTKKLEDIENILRGE